MINKFIFCPRCKNKLTKINEKLIDCSKCRFHFYFNSSPTNALIIENEKKEILLVKRKFNPGKNKWDLPGGFLDLNETVEESVEREIKEELGIKIKKFNYLISVIDHYFYKGINYPTICFIFYTKIKKPLKVKPFDDVSEIKFFPREKIPWKEIAFEGIMEALKKYLLID